MTREKYNTKLEISGLILLYSYSLGFLPYKKAASFHLFDKRNAFASRCVPVFYISRLISYLKFLKDENIN